jgi:PAS domain S-box-containing protein
MFKNIKIGSKITSLTLLVVLLTVVAVSFIAYKFSEKSIEGRYLESLNAVADLKVEQIDTYFKQAKINADLISELPVVKSQLYQVREKFASKSDSLGDLYEELWTPYLSAIKNKNRIQNIYITNTSGQVVYSTDSKIPFGRFISDPDGNTLSESRAGYYFSNIYWDGPKMMLTLGAPLFDRSNVLSGLLLLQLNMEDVYSLVSDSVGLGKTGEIMLGKIYNNKVLYINPLRHDPSAAMKLGVYMGEKTGFPMQRAVKGKNGAGKDIDYRKEQTLATWRHIPVVDWGLVVKIDTSEIYSDATGLVYKLLIAAAVIILLSLMISIIFSRVLISPLLSLKSSMQLLGKGVLPNTVEKVSNDEIGQMAETMSNLVQALKRTASFAHKIGEGHFDADFQPLSENDTLGTALLTMRDSIQEAEKNDKERNWIVTGVAEVGEILRSNDNLEQLGDEIITYVTKKINAIQGAFYVVNDDDKDNQFIEMKSSYAYNRKKYLKAQFKFAEGLVGQSAIEQDTILRTEVPGDYVTITSGLLGDQRPECILIVPLITEEKVFGVLEFAGFQKFTPSEVKFVEEISLIIARTVFNIKVNERTRKLLEESQKMSNELQLQQEVLRQNAEEMEATQEELKRTNHRLEEQIEEVNRTQKRMQLLLENASEVITIYEEDGTVRYISPSVERIFGYPSSDLIGKKDISNVHPDSVEVVENMFAQLLEHPGESVTIQYMYNKKNGEAIWIESSATNLLSDPAIQGILINSRDITERRRAEQEQRMRSQMQALSENSPDLITRINSEGTFFYINPVIEAYTGYKPDYFIKKEIKEVDITPSISDQWIQILEEVKQKNDKVSLEMDFPCPLGDRVMQVNAIPEFNEDKQMESVLMVSHDITERKLIELEIEAKNKKITESINYSKRIQGAILPNNTIIKKVLPESFILYKAKDVVSGDFPWFLQIGDDIYIAAVDCTGHGVPGALISLIGYFLLNDIVRSRKVSEPGIILDLLDEGVTQTLRQDQDDSKTKDGMDIALCKINLKKGELEYAGAHRPLYYLDNGGELEEIKGNKFPIGGGIYRNQTNFTNTKIKFKKGDTVYFCSDGFPDQFGGPENRKFGPKRLRDLILESKGNSMEENYHTFDSEWEGWKADGKQTDDVLLIGIRF